MAEGGNLTFSSEFTEDELVLWLKQETLGREINLQQIKGDIRPQQF